MVTQTKSNEMFNNDMDIEERIQPLFPVWVSILFVGIIFGLGVVGFIAFVIEALNWK